MSRRYVRNTVTAGGKAISTSTIIPELRLALQAGYFTVTEITLKENTRLDHLAAQRLGDPRFWWVIAALSEIGWGMQLPPGTRILIPNDMTKILGLIG